MDGEAGNPADTQQWMRWVLKRCLHVFQTKCVWQKPQNIPVLRCESTAHRRLAAAHTNHRDKPDYSLITWRSAVGLYLLVRGYFNQPRKRLHSAADGTLGRIFIVFFLVSKSFYFPAEFVSRQEGYRVRFQANNSQNMVDTLTLVFSKLFARYSLSPFWVSGGLTCGSTADESVAPCCDTRAWSGLISSDCSFRHLCHKINELVTDLTCPPGISALFGWMKLDHLKTFLCFKHDHRQDSPAESGIQHQWICKTGYLNVTTKPSVISDLLKMIRTRENRR